MIVCGIHACRAVLLRRPAEVERLFIVRERRADLEDLLAGAPFPVVEAPAKRLDGLCRSVHHEGAVLHVRDLDVLSVERLVKDIVPEGAYLALDRVMNPHNFGSLLRSAAYFECSAVIWSDDPARPAFGPASIRVAEGGAEWVPLCRADDLAPVLAAMKAAGARIVGAEARAPSSIFSCPLPFPVVLVLGQEREGLSPAVRKRCDAFVSIPGSPRIDSLNLAVAGGILLGEMARLRAERRRGG